MAIHTDTFSYRILIVDDEPSLRETGKRLLEAKGFEVHCAEDGFKGLAALKEALPDVIISDLRMPNMNGFEFLSVVRRRFPMIAVIVISGEFSNHSVPQNVLADAFFTKGGFKTEELFEKIIALVHELPTRPKPGKPAQAAVWAPINNGLIAVTCCECLRTFQVSKSQRGMNEAECDFCSSMVPFEIVGNDALSKTELSLARQSA
jgi:CheY-like chemotaxis protein